MKLGAAVATALTLAATTSFPSREGLRVVAPRVPPSPNALRASESYGKLPLGFEANHGQTDSRVKFLSRGPGYTLFLTPTEAVLALRKPAGRGSSTELKMTLAGANRSPRISGRNASPAESNYFVGTDRRQGANGETGLAPRFDAAFQVALEPIEADQEARVYDIIERRAAKDEQQPRIGGHEPPKPGRERVTERDRECALPVRLGVRGGVADVDHDRALLGCRGGERLRRERPRHLDVLPEPGSRPVDLSHA